MTLLGVMGDVHSNESAFVYGLKLMKTQGASTIVQLGDFGFWPGEYGQKYLNVVSEALTDHNMQLIVVPGNHEDYNQIKRLPTNEEGWQQARTRIRVAPRGHRWEWDGVSFVALGGAPSVDRAWRIADQRKMQSPLWWKDEAITVEEAQATIDGGRADVMFAHDAPFDVPQIEKRIEHNPLGFTAEDLKYALDGRMLMRTVVDAISPKLYMHGHYHFPVDDEITSPFTQESTRIRGLTADGTICTYAILDLDDLSVSIIS